MPKSNGHLPAYDDLPVSPGAPPKSSWGLWGPGDQLGALNLLSADKIVDAAALVKKGAVFPLNWEMELPDPIIARGRRDLPRHTYVIYGKASIEDVLDNYYPQSSSQWDAFSHSGTEEYGFYNGAQLAEVTSVLNPKLGIENWARRGIVGRGVLADFGRWAEKTAKGFDFTTNSAITVEDLELTLESQGVELRTGDILLLRTGWMAFYLAQPPVWKAKIGRRPMIPGLESSTNMVRHLWNHHIAAVAADNYMVEAGGNHMEGLHRNLLALCGVPLGEFWFLEQLADDCAADGVYEFMLTSAPLNKRGGAGSPPNALAIK